MKLQVLHPNNKDIRFALGDLEAAMLQELWKSPTALSVREFHEKIARNRSIAVTTVATILDRLYRKGVLSRKLVREGGPHYLYSSRLTKDAFKHVVVNNVMGALLRGFNDVTVAYLAEKMADKPEDRRIISKYLNRLKSEGGK
ncbi:MAG: BlaI/MecI/CopY family transcriptional regulator [Candidatus Bathyarchaeia archaeon]